MKNKSTFPVIMIQISVLTSFAIITIGHLLTAKPLVFLSDMGFTGFDYYVFFNASSNIKSGISPYEISQNIPNNGYVTTPIPAIINLLFVPLGFEKAKIIMYILITVSMLIGFGVLISAFNVSDVNKAQIYIAGLVCLLFGYPFYFLLERVNIDGWVFLFLSLGLLFFTKQKMEWMSSLFFSLAIVFKIYPILIVIPIVLYRKWRLLKALSIWLFLWGIISLFWFSDFENAMIYRAHNFFSYTENGSMVATLVIFGLFFEAVGFLPQNSSLLYAQIVSMLFYGLLIFLVIYADFKASKNEELEPTAIILYFPFMVAIPKVVYHYSFIILLMLLPVMCFIWGNSRSKVQKNLIVIVSIGVSLTQWQSIALFHLTQNLIAQVIPGIGLLLIMFGIVFYKLLKLQQYPKRTT